MKQTKIYNSILILLGTCALAFSLACAKPSDTGEETEAAPSKVELKSPVQIKVEDLIISSDNSRLLSGIEYVDGCLYIAEKKGVIYRLNFDMSDLPKASIDTGFGEYGKITINEEIRTIAASGKDLIIRTRKGLYQLQEGELSTIENIPAANGFSFSRNGLTGVGHRTGSGTADERVPVVLLKRSEAGLISTSVLNGNQHGITNLSKSAITSSLILLGGASPKTEGKGLRHELVAFSHEGEFQFRVGNDDATAPDGFANVNDIEALDEIIYLLDSNLRDLLVIATSGEVLSKIDIQKFLGIGYSWFPDCTIGPDGSLIVAAVNDEDERKVQVAKFFIIPLSKLLPAAN